MRYSLEVKPKSVMDFKAGAMPYSEAMLQLKDHRRKLEQAISQVDDVMHNLKKHVEEEWMDPPFESGYEFGSYFEIVINVS